MDLKSFFGTFVLHFFLIYALTMIASFVFLAAQGIETVAVDHLWQAAVFSLAADAPLALFITKKGEEITHYRLRLAVHACLLELFLMPIGYFWNMWSGVGGAFAFFFTVLAVDFFMQLLNFLSSKMLSSDINRAIISRRSNKKQGDEAMNASAAIGADEEDGESVADGDVGRNDDTRHDQD